MNDNFQNLSCTTAFQCFCPKDIWSLFCMYLYLFTESNSNFTVIEVYYELGQNEKYFCKIPNSSAIPDGQHHVQSVKRLSVPPRQNIF